MKMLHHEDDFGEYVNERQAATGITKDPYDMPEVYPCWVAADYTDDKGNWRFVFFEPHAAMMLLEEVVKAHGERYER